ncbi:DUF917 domain-containing protein [Actinomadura rudentiformis]|uniref:DUF917 domain-containing protein n=1 Tax=Actinomadura rudentiformis TaxID=359158 RepID=A0A6H9YGI4_9ACTN|nr:DUF917 domain-containing protein [Actinomadura rudentiformis]KAB2339452.1 DUF917 domain-containing protein [Actinomadura rudentiformis]
MTLLDGGTLPTFARGCAVLGSGGGGGVDVVLAAALQAVADHGPVPVLQPEDLDATALVMPCGVIGSPAVGAERIGGGTEAQVLRDTVERLHGAPVAALMSSEIGGSNGCHAVAWAARLGLPLVDADAMGRAFPRMNQNAMELAGIAPTPCVLTDERGRTVVLDHVDGRWLERLARGVLEAFGGQAATSEYVLRAGQVRTAAVPGSVSRALAIGTALADGVPDEFSNTLPDEPGGGLDRLITGKISTVDRTGAGATAAIVEGLGPDAGRLLRLEAQSEYLAAFEDGRPLILVPDIIAVLDTRTAAAIDVERLRYGLRVSVLALPCAPVWNTPEGRRLGGPAAFGLDAAVTSSSAVMPGGVIPETAR